MEGNLKRKLSLIKISRQDAESCSQIYSPKFESDIEISRKFSLGQEVAASATDRDLRNVAFHRKYFALLKLAYSNLPHNLEKLFANIEEFRTELKIQIGCRERRVSMSGKEYFIPKSMRFDKMSQTEFEEVYSKTLDFICVHVLRGVDKKELDDQIMDFL